MKMISRFQLDAPRDEGGCMERETVPNPSGRGHPVSQYCRHRPVHIVVVLGSALRFCDCHWHQFISEARQLLEKVGDIDCGDESKA